MNFKSVILAGALLAAAQGNTAVAGSNSVSISNNSGGGVANYALKAAEYRDSGTLVRFAGRCDSACTLYLGLPRHQTCISKGAYFRFHSSLGGSSRSIRTANAYLMSKYPGWVRSWVNQHGGLTKSLKTMDYSYAQKFIPDCAKLASR